jgi:hypothetical protein
MKNNFIIPDLSHILCKVRPPTSEEISLYKNEKDPDKRLEMAYEYQISKDDLYPEDYDEILRIEFITIQQIIN